MYIYQSATRKSKTMSNISHLMSIFYSLVILCQTIENQVNIFHGQKKKYKEVTGIKALSKKLSSMGLSVREIIVVRVIAAVAMVIGVDAVEASPMAMELHVPLKACSALLAMEQTGSQVTSLDVGNQRALAAQAGITDVTEELARHLRLVGDGAGEVGQHATLIGRRTRASGTSSQLSTIQISIMIIITKTEITVMLSYQGRCRGTVDKLRMLMALQNVRLSATRGS